MATEQELQNRNIIDYATRNFSTQTHEYGRPDMEGDIANKRTKERVDGSRNNQDLDGDDRKGVDCSSMVYFSLKGAGFNVEQMSKTPFGTGSLFNGYHMDHGVKIANVTPEAKSNFDYVQNKSDLKPGDLVMFKMSATAQHVAIYAGKNEKGQDQFFGSQTSTGPKMVNMDTDPYWSKREYLGALRPKEEFIKPEFKQQGTPEMHYNGSQLEPVSPQSSTAPATTPANGDQSYKDAVLTKTTAAIHDLCDARGYPNHGGRDNMACHLASDLITQGSQGTGKFEAALGVDGKTISVREQISEFKDFIASADSNVIVNIPKAESLAKIAAYESPVLTQNSPTHEQEISRGRSL